MVGLVIWDAIAPIMTSLQYVEALHADSGRRYHVGSIK